MNLDPRLSSLLERWQTSYDRGQLLSLTDLCRDCPELRQPLEKQVALLRVVEGILRASGKAGSHNTVGSLAGTRPDTPGHTSPAGYEITGLLGRGAMGVVYRARQLALNREVAMKMILAGSHADKDERARFLREAEAVAAVRHPGIVQVFDFGTHEGHPYCALELCEGGTLADRLRQGPLSPREAARVVEQIARSVQAAHECGIIHRDLKPGNVLLASTTVEPGPESENSTQASQSIPKVGDFGLAKRLGGGGTLTQTGAVVGTPQYMAPEQAQGKKDLGPGADVYALGAILYECLTGRPPFQAANVWDVVRQVITDDPLAVRQLQKKVPRDLETICHRCLQKEVRSRYGSAAELADELGRWQRGEPIQARPVGLAERAIKWGRRRPVVAGLSALTLLALLGGSVTSTVLWLEAKRQAAVADQERENAKVKEREAVESARQATAAARKTIEEVAKVEEGVAGVLFRPLSQISVDTAQYHEVHTQALEALAELPSEFDRVRLLFIDGSLFAPKEAKQLDDRLRSNVHAAVGLDNNRRKKVLDAVARRLRQSRWPEVRVVCARIVGTLVVDESSLAREALTVLLTQTPDAIVPERDELPLLRLLGAID